MMPETTIDRWIEAKGINGKATYTIGQVAGMLGLGYDTVYRYCYIGRRTKHNGVISLATVLNGSRYEINGSDLIDFVRAIQ
jgi:hypothetical protein